MQGVVAYHTTSLRIPQENYLENIKTFCLFRLDTSSVRGIGIRHLQESEQTSLIKRVVQIGLEFDNL